MATKSRHSLDPQLIRTIRVLGCAVSLLLALICLLTYRGSLQIDGARLGICLPLSAAFLLVGVTQLFWSPYTRLKAAVYVNAYMIMGSLASIFVTGFSTLAFIYWTVLMAVMLVSFGVIQAILGYLVVEASLIVWLLRPGIVQSHSAVIFDFLSLVAVGALMVFVESIWATERQGLDRLRTSHAKSDYEHGQLTSLINSMADGVIAVDEKAEVVLYNAAALNVLDLNTSLQGKRLSRFMHIVDKDHAAVDVAKLILGAQQAIVSRDYLIQYTDGSFANLYLSIAPVHLGYGKTGEHGFVLLLRDITHEKSLEEERDEFISVVSHELRTPIAIAEGNISNAQLMADKAGDNAKIKQALDEAHNQVLFLADMINDLATLSRAERGKLEVQPEAINVSELLAELAKSYQEQAAAKGLQLEVQPADLPVLNSSQLYVGEILQNFVTNAIKYTEKGRITVSAQALDDGVRFLVSDSGIGISKTDQERVFDKFFRSEDFRTRQTNGTGLGLYVTAKLARLIHADINLESELNKGSTFSIDIPNLTK